MKKMINNLLAGIVLAGVAVQTALAAPDVIESALFEPGIVAEQKLAGPELPRVEIGHTVRLDAMVETNQALQKQALAAKQGTVTRALQTGIQRDIEQTDSVQKLARLLQWQQTAEGGFSTAIRFIVSGAEASRITLAVDRLPAASTLLFISEQTGEEVLVTGEEIIANISLAQGESNQYAGPSLEGETVVLEVHLPPGFTPEDVDVAIPALTHIFVPLSDLGAYSIKSDSEDPEDYSCLRNSVCDRTYDSLSNSVAAIHFQQNGSSYLCTGTLLNSRPVTYIPYMITASHCIDSQVVASTVETYWFYRSSACNGTGSTRGELSRGGANLLLNYPDADTSFLRLSNAPPAGVVLAGSALNAVDTGVAVANISHPLTDRDYTQKLAQGRVNNRANCGASSANGSFQCFVNNNGSYLVVGYSSGVTFGGSSGSGIFVTNSSAEHFYAGTLRGGSSSCSSRDGLDLYGRFDLAYTAGISRWLTPENPTVERNPVYRLFHTRKGTHFFTASLNERNNVVAKYPEYVAEGTAFYAYAKAGQGMEPVYRFFNTRTGTHFYTISSKERASIQSKWPHFIYEGVAWYASSKSLNNSQPLHRFFNTRTGTHFYTRNEQEKNNVIAKYKHFTYEGVAYHVWASK